MSRTLVVMRGSLSTDQFVPSRSISCRIIEPLTFIRDSSGKGFKFDVAKPEEIQLSSLNNYSSIVFCKHNTMTTVNLAMEAKKRGIKVVYDIDDLIYRFTSDSMAYGHMKNVEYLKMHLESADTVVTSTKTLDSIIRNDFSINQSVVIRTGINTDKFFRYSYQKNSQKILFTNGDNIKITHFQNDFIKVFNSFMENHQSLEFEVFGDSEKYLEGFNKYKFLGSLPWHAHKEFLMRTEYAFAIVPLGAEEESDEHRLFSICKSPIKFLEYGALRIPSIYSNAFIYRDVVQDQKTGLLVDNNSKAWENALEQFVSDPELRAEIADNAFEEVHQRHHIRIPAKQWSEILSQSP